MNEEEIFYQALERRVPDERAAYLEQACAGNPALRASVEALLRANVGASGFMDQPNPPLGLTLDAPVSERPGTLIGPYKLLEQIGEGGFGVVFMAEQTQPVRRKVALKVLKPGMDTHQVVARFEAERQALAIMDHPNIAKVYDGGATASGRPYFVMELVKGVPITEFCDQNHLRPRQRLELFLGVCQAVQHAHHKGIIHRDLKPSNVLVTVHDTTPVVKVIDFGVAKALGQELTDKTLFTGLAQMVGTPLYMSPEQAGQSGLDIDTRSDIYSLGVLLYELLTGTTPFEKERFKQAAYDEIRRIIREEEPPRPSTRLSDSKDSLPSISAQRHMEPAKLTKLVRGELDWIVMKALEKDRNRRYETANGFAQDLQRYLADEPVQACPPSLGYRLQKFTRRNKTALTAGALVVLALVVGTVVSSWQAIEATVARDAESKARKEEREARDALDSAREEKEQQRLRTNRELSETLLEAARLQAKARLARPADNESRNQLRATLGRARTLASSAFADPVLVGREQAFQKELKQEEADRRMVARLEEIRLNKDNGKLSTVLGATYPLYAAAFRDYGLPFFDDSLSIDEAARRIAASSIRDALVAALDDCCSSTGFDRLLQIAQRASKDKWRQRYFKARRRNDQAALIQLAKEPEALEQPPAILAMLAFRIGTSYDRRGLELLRKGQHRYPADFWMNYTVGEFLSHGGYRTIQERQEASRRVEESVGFYRAALVGRPESQALKDRLADSLGNVAGFLYDHGSLYQPAVLGYLNEAIELADRAYPGAWRFWNMRGSIYASLGKWDQAISDHTRATELISKLPGSRHQASYSLPWHNRAYCYAVLGQWDKAAADSAKAVELREAQEAQPTGGRLMVSIGEWWMERASYHVQAGDIAAYRTDCQQMLDRFGQTKEPLIAQQIALSCLLIPQAVRNEKLVLRLAEQSVAGTPDAQWCVITLGAALYRAGQFEAAADVGSFVNSWPEDPYASIGADGGPVLTWLVLAMTHHHLGHAEEARRWLDKAVRRMDQENAAKDIGPLRRQCHVWAMCLALRKEAQALLAKAGTDKGSRIALVRRHNPYMTFSIGRALWRKGAYHEAIAEFTKAVESKADYVEAWTHRAYVRAWLGQDESAIADYTKGIELNAKNAGLWHDRGLARARLGQWDQAIADNSKAIELGLRLPTAWANRGSAYASLGQLDRAVADYTKASDMDPKNANLHNDLAWRLATHPNPIHDPGRAVEWAKKAVHLAPKHANYWNTLGVAHYRAGDWKAALAALENLIGLTKGGSSFDWYFLAMCHEKLGDKEKAREWYNRATRWMDKNQATNEELCRFRVEAAQVLGVGKKKE